MGGVGSRRWAKFSKLLARRGYEVEVITTKYPYVDKVNWSYDVEHPNISVHHIKAGIASTLLKESKSNIERIVGYIFNRLFKPLFYYLDSGQRWHKYLIPYARHLIRQKKIRNVIVTGPPSSVHYFASFLKIENPLINLIQDFRDTWNDDIDYEYKTSLRFFWQKERSAMMEDFAFFHADKIIFVTKDIETRYSKQYPIFQDKFAVVYNGYDRDDLRHSMSKVSNANGSFSLVYAGNLGLGREKAIPLLAEAIDLQDDDYVSDLRINIFSNIRLKDFEDHPSYQSIRRHVSFQDPVDPQQISEIISSHSYGLSINSEIYPYAFGTKVFDYMGAGKKILLISNGGELYDYLKRKGSFAAKYCVSEIASELKKMKMDYLKSGNPVNEYPEFDLETLTDKIESLLSNDAHDSFSSR